jgi:thiol-disulfide isomerase/thioredoxin
MRAATAPIPADDTAVPAPRAARATAARAGLPALLLAGAALLANHPVRAAADPVLPEFTHVAAGDWLNTAPLRAAALRGRPVLVEFWTFGCSNCLASLPWMHAAAARYRGRGLTIVGVHTPELPAEYRHDAVRAAVARLGIDYPVMIDDDYSYWRALGNHYWPAFYLYDSSGRLIATHIGELHVGESRSDAFAELVERSLSP